MYLLPHIQFRTLEPDKYTLNVFYHTIIPSIKASIKERKNYVLRELQNLCSEDVDWYKIKELRGCNGYVVISHGGAHQSMGRYISQALQKVQVKVFLDDVRRAPNAKVWVCLRVNTIYILLKLLFMATLERIIIIFFSLIGIIFFNLVSKKLMFN